MLAMVAVRLYLLDGNAALIVQNCWAISTGTRVCLRGNTVANAYSTGDRCAPAGVTSLLQFGCVTRARPKC